MLGMSLSVLGIEERKNTSDCLHDSCSLKGDRQILTRELWESIKLGVEVLTATLWQSLGSCLQVMKCPKKDSALRKID